jgi:hypothetical protein
MVSLDLTWEELNTLKELLDNDIAELRMEIIHTDTSQFREMLKHKELILKKILAMLQAFEKV